ncbi:hypothetical protein OPQ81_000607 [Rhizoctonia solani]|nr:hypothetical protein OPQ81_000607 [Rhizoctonia solani]
MIDATFFRVQSIPGAVLHRHAQQPSSPLFKSKTMSLNSWATMTSGGQGTCEIKRALYTRNIRSSSNVASSDFVMDLLVHGVLIHFTPIELPMFVPDVDTSRTGHTSITTTLGQIYDLTAPRPGISKLWIVRLVVSFVGFVTYGTLRVTEVVDFESDFEDDLDLDFIHIPIGDWVERMKLGWTRERFLFMLQYEDMASYVGKNAFNWARDAFLRWIYRNIQPFPSGSEIQASASARSQFVIRPVDCIDRCPHLQNMWTEHRLERTRTQDQIMEKIEPEAAQEQRTEAEQEEQLKTKRHTRRGGKKYHEKKQRKLERMSTHGDSEYGEEKAVVLSSSEPR